MYNRGPKQRTAEPSNHSAAQQSLSPLGREQIRLLQEDDYEEALRKAIEESCRIHAPYEGYNHRTFFPNSGPVAGDGNASASPNHAIRPSSEEDEEEQLRRAIEESLKPAEKTPDPLEQEALEIQKLIAEMEAAEKRQVAQEGAVAVDVPIDQIPLSDSKQDSSPEAISSRVETSPKRSPITIHEEHEEPVMQAEDNKLPQKIEESVRVESTATTAAAAVEFDEPQASHAAEVPVSQEELVVAEISHALTVEESSHIGATDEIPAEEIIPADEISTNEISTDEIRDLSIPAQIADASKVEEDATVVTEEGEEQPDDDWEMVGEQMEGTVLLQECDSEDEGSIAEPDVFIRTSPLRTSQQAAFPDETANMSSSSASQQELVEEEFDPILAQAHQLLERSGFVAIERNLLEESDEFIDSLLREHEKDLQSSMLSLGGRQSGLLSGIEEVAEEDVDDFVSVIDEDEQKEEGNELFYSAHSTTSQPAVVATAMASDVPVTTKPAAEYNLTVSQLKALPLASNSIRFPPDVFELLKRGKYQFEREHGVKLTFSNAKDCVITLHHNDPDVQNIGLSELQSIIRDSDQFESQLLALQAENTHIFVDNSNIFIGSQIVGIDKKTKKFIYDHSLRLNHRALDRVVNNQRNCQRKFVVGSTESGEQQTCVWAKHWEKVGYKVYLHPFSSEGKESVVDSSLIAEITIHIGNIDRQRKKNPSQSGRLDTLVLLTGDGNDNQGNASLFAAVEHALDAGWNVELWCWRLSTSKNYRRLADQYSSSGRFGLRFLDNYRDEIIFKQVRKTHIAPNDDRTK